MKLSFKIGTEPARRYHVCRKWRAPVVGESFKIVDKNVHGSKPFSVRCTDIKSHTGGGVIYFVEPV